MEAFSNRSNYCLNAIVDHIGTLDNKSDIRRFTGIYQHLMKLQRQVFETQMSPESIRQFDSDWNTCELALRGIEADECDGEDEDEQPTKEQLETFKKTVAAWVELDDEEKRLRKAAMEKKTLKDRLSTSISAFMNRYGIEDLDVDAGDKKYRMKYFTRQVKVMPSKAIQLSRISDFFGENPDMVKKFHGAVYQTETVTKSGIRRLK